MLLDIQWLSPAEAPKAGAQLCFGSCYPGLMVTFTTPHPRALLLEDTGTDSGTRSFCPGAASFCLFQSPLPYFWRITAYFLPWPFFFTKDVAYKQLLVDFCKYPWKQRADRAPAAYLGYWEGRYKGKIPPNLCFNKLPAPSQTDYLLPSIICLGAIPESYTAVPYIWILSESFS